VDYYEFFGRYQATLFGAKSKIKTTQNAHNSPLLFFCMKLWTYLTRLGKEKKIFVHRQFKKINVKISGKTKFQQITLIRIKLLISKYSKNEPENTIFMFVKGI